MISNHNVYVNNPKVRSGLSAILALLLYGVISFAYFGKLCNWNKMYLGHAGDQISFIWFLNWWPYAIAHNLNPLLTNFVWFPHGFNLTWATTVPFPALLGLPITLTAGPVFTYNIFSVAAPMLSAWTAFLLARYVTRNWPAAFVGGYVYGFSSYELGQLLGHLNLDLTFLIPLAVLISIQRARGELQRFPFVTTLIIILFFEFGISTEIFATLCFLGAAVWAVFFILAPQQDRHGLWRLAVDILIAGACTFILISPFLVYLVKGLPDVPPLGGTVVANSADPLSFIMPTIVTYLGGSTFATDAAKLTSNPSEQGAYLGLPLIILLTLYFRNAYSNRYKAAFMLAFLGLVFCSLGPFLHLYGRVTHIEMPWHIALYLPLIKSAMPIRFNLYVSLCAGIAVACYLATPVSIMQKTGRFFIALLACLFLFPNLGIYPWTAWPAQAFFASENIQKALPLKPNVLILPYGGDSRLMAWQVQAHMGFTQTGGYVGFPPMNEQNWSIFDNLAKGLAGPRFANDFSALCVAHHVQYVLAGPGTPAPLAAVIAALHWPQHLDHGITVITVPPVSDLSFTLITGDYWPSDTAPEWMGQKLTIITNNKPITITLSDPITTGPINVTLTSPGMKKTFEITDAKTATFSLPASVSATLLANHTIIPDRLLHNFDTRPLSVHLHVAGGGT